jgi:hypothetical protein
MTEAARRMGAARETLDVAHLKDPGGHSLRGAAWGGLRGPKRGEVGGTWSACWDHSYVNRKPEI